MTQIHTDIPARGPNALSKPQLDVGFFTNKLEPMLAFWREVKKSSGIAGNSQCS